MEKHSLNKKAVIDENFLRNLDAIETIIATASEQLCVPFTNIIDILKQRNKQQLFVPSCILRNLNLGILEAVVKYLKEEHELTYSKIAKILNRDERVIWVTYNKACAKEKKHFEILLPNQWIPISVFAQTKYGPLESLSKFLIDSSHDYKSAAILLNRNPKSIQACYMRAKK